ncbi:HK97 family phage prohead protease [Vibrio fluvialis]|uniref:HK97 family phage prohead protease n=1 Tax=Vibrio fluvialis TaxID=676 RepID=UPI0028DDEDF4|nr:HK97 family phage prohead protease [Vibrio fluvialis]MDT8865853.1 HK97 family phage prohead protease [Vibrio fluvialis]MDT8873621.1 HK97 family phage prohead protease [Vibrio fluvialis]
MSVKFSTNFEVKNVDPEQGTFVGLANKKWYRDFAGDVTVDGAFKASIEKHKAAGTMPKLLFQHDHSKVIGKITDMWEDDEGLWIKGEIFTDISLGHDVYVLLKRGAIEGLSIGYITRDENYDVGTNTNFLRELDIHEVSVVTFACNDQSSVTDIKSRNDETEQREKAKAEFQTKLNEASLYFAIKNASNFFTHK